ncbi:MAG TPA: glucose-1-phosphate adenylyltransferase [Candidatus Tripitaka californicus]|uniref:glucose-1-phosphate adenylyltransferase n=1 Tax=Candidatus Tripitaka californicus TaxID=3367616 RepID=UPI004027C117|nr:glucose-1-phosphate adenylyltransferase [Planctomycetota bacterium]
MVSTNNELLKRILVMILAGGEGQRLYPLTKDRAKPAVPFGGIYRIIDFSLSNCLNSGLHKVVILTQYKSLSLDRHIRMGWWDLFNCQLDEYVEIIPPQMRVSDQWYRGTADAIYHNIYTLEREHPEKVLILGGDHIYKMDYRKMLHYHMEKQADLTVGAVEVPLEEAHRFGVLQVDEQYRILGFQEKPKTPRPMPSDPNKVLASMGIYLFNTEVLVRRVVEDAKKPTSHDFGKDVIPAMVGRDKVFACPFEDENKKPIKYWRDIGTLEAYWEANMDLLAVDPLFNLYDKDWPIRTFQEQFPPVKTVLSNGEMRGMALDSLVSPGCIISGARVVHSVLSPDVRIEIGSEIIDSVVLEGVRIGKNASIKRAIIDKGVVVPDNTHIGHNPEEDHRHFTVTDNGIVVVPKEMPFI